MFQCLKIKNLHYIFFKFFPIPLNGWHDPHVEWVENPKVEVTEYVHPKLNVIHKYKNFLVRKL